MTDGDLGAHVSVAGGLETCFGRALELGARAIQIFVKNQRQWAARPLRAAEIAAFERERERAGPRVRTVVAHATYLINLSSPDATIYERSVATFAEELRRAERLGLAGVIVHPGSSPLGRDDAIARTAAGISAAAEVSGGRPIIEAMPGGGGRIGGRFEDLRAVLDALPAEVRERAGVCIDTCHLHVAGYRIRTAGEVDALLAEFARVVGLGRLRAVHLNDSKGAFGSRLDRHANLGKGTIGTACFEAIVNDPRLRGIPKILETPREGAGVERDLALLRRLREKGRGESARGKGGEGDGVQGRKRRPVRGPG